MECRPLDITVLAAKGLKDVNLFSKMDVYAVVTLSGADRRHTPPQKTTVDKDAGTSPQWNFPIKFPLDESAVQMDRLNLVFTVMSDRALGDKVVGEVRVPVKELLDSCGDGKSEKTVSYAVQTPKGKSKGSLDFSYRFGEKYTYTAPALPHAAIPASVKGSDDPVTAYPAKATAAGSSSAYAAYPPQGYAQPGYGYPPQYAPPTYGYPPQYPPSAYGYPQAVQKPPKKSGGSKLGMGLAGGLLGGLLIGDMISDVGDMAAYDAGYDAGFDDGGFDY